MIICFCLNNLGAFGIGTTLTSLIRNCSDISKLKFYFICSLVNEDIKEAIKALLKKAMFEGEYDFIDFDPDIIFKNYRSLQGDRTTYGRLLIPDIIKRGQVLYLDSDLIIETDILSLADIDMNGAVLGATGGSSFRHQLEHEFYIDTLHLKEDIQSFNAGVLIINISAWTAHSIKQKLFELADKFPDRLLAADQTLLNAFFAGNFFNIPSKYNVTWYADKKPGVETDAIFHFVGSPKPWDFFGKQLHTGYDKWQEYNPASWKKNVLNKFKTAQFKRTWNIRRSYLKTLLKK